MLEMKSLKISKTSCVNEIFINILCLLRYFLINENVSRYLNHRFVAIQNENDSHTIISYSN